MSLVYEASYILFLPYKREHYIEINLEFIGLVVASGLKMYIFLTLEFTLL